MEETHVTSTADGGSTEEFPAQESEAGESLALAAAHYRAAPAKTVDSRLRVLGIPLPIAGVSWIGSIVIHAAIILIGAGLYRHFHPPVKPEMALGDGGFHPVGMMWRESQPGGEGLPELSEIDAAHPPPNSMNAVMRQIENQKSSDPPMHPMASSYAAPELLWGSTATVGAGHSESSRWGTPATRRPAGPPEGTKSTPTPASHQGEGAGHGRSNGSGSGTINGGQAGVPSGIPDPTLPAPVYPEAARRRGEEGTVKLSFTVQGDGSVGNISIISEPPYSLLTRAAVETVQKWHFDRGYAGVTIVRAFSFVLN